MKKHTANIQDGDYGVPAVTNKMWQLVNRDAKDKKVIEVAKSLETEDKLKTIRNVFNYVADNFDYKSDPPNVEHFTAPKYFLNGEYSKHLDCDDMVGILAVLLTVLKIPVRFKAIAWRLPQFTHIIAEAHCCGKWYELDAVQGRAGFNNSIPKSKRVKEQIFENPMRKFVTLEDGCCRGHNGYSRSRGENDNNNANSNIININTGENGYSNIPGKPKIQKEIEKVPVPYPVEKKVKIPVPYPVEKIKKEYVKVPVDREVVRIKKVKVPVRAIAKEPVQFYREFL